MAGGLIAYGCEVCLHRAGECGAYFEWAYTVGGDWNTRIICVECLVTKRFDVADRITKEVIYIE